MNEKVVEELVDLLGVLLGGFIGTAASLVLTFYRDSRNRQLRREDRQRELRNHNISRIERYLDSRITMIKSLTTPLVTTTTILDYMKADPWRQAGSVEEARACARFLNDSELAQKLGELERIFLRVWNAQENATRQQNLVEEENEAIQLYHDCADHIEALKATYLT